MYVVPHPLNAITNVCAKKKRDDGRDERENLPCVVRFVPMTELSVSESSSRPRTKSTTLKGRDDNRRNTCNAVRVQ